jgi:hypothetical protein
VVFWFLMNDNEFDVEERTVVLSPSDVAAEEKAWMQLGRERATKRAAEEGRA